VSYATPEQLRLQTGVEFELRLDDALQAALDDASQEIDSYRPAGSLSAEALDVLRLHCIRLARLGMYPDQALDETHPVLREARATRRWLGMLASGQVRLPAGDDSSGGTGAEWSSFGTVWGRDAGGGLA
jgi:phage gp36-like protein